MAGDITKSGDKILGPRGELIYEPVTSVFLPAIRFSSVGGSPTLDVALGVPGGRSPSWAFDGATTETIAGLTDIPPGWATIDVILHWSQAAGLTGNVKWSLAYGSLALPGGDLGAAESIAAGAVAAAPSNAIIASTTVGEDLAVNPKQLLRLEVTRTGGDATDTHTGDVGLIMVELQKAS